MSNNVYDSFVINLERRPDRLKDFCEKNGDKINVMRAKAIDGRLLEFNEQISIDGNPIISKKLTERFVGLKIGEIGCFLSHYFLWKKIADSDKPCIIFEDDVVLCDDFNKKLNSVIEKGLPTNCEVLYLGIWQDYENDFFYRNYIKNNKHLLVNTHFYPFNSVNNLEGGDFYAYAYIITPESCKVICEHIENTDYKLQPLDHFLCRCDNKYVCFYNDNEPFLCHAPQGDSDIQTNHNDNKENAKVFL